MEGCRTLQCQNRVWSKESNKELGKSKRESSQLTSIEWNEVEGVDGEVIARVDVDGLHESDAHPGPE